MGRLNVSKLSHRNNMVPVRFVAALAILFAHFEVVFCTSIWPFAYSSYYAVGIFFAFSGFLNFVGYANYAGQERGVIRFFRHRAQRLFPAYWCVVLLCAFGLFFVSTCTAGAYFLSAEFWKYLAANISMLNFLGPTLPGVFDGFPVNGALWTMKVECMCYATVPLVYMLLNKYGKYTWHILLGIGLLSIFYRVVSFEMYVRTGTELYNILSRQLMGQLIFFYTGVAVRLAFQEFVKYRHGLAAVSLLLLLVFDGADWFTLTLSPIVVTILALYLSFCVPVVDGSLKLPPISYTLYLFHFPVILLFKHFRAMDVLGLVPTLISVVAVSLLFAYLCWSQVELRFRSVVKK